MIRVAYMLLGLSLLIPAVGNAEPKMDPDYPKVRAELVPPILAMKSGVYEGKAELPWRLYVPENLDKAKKYPLVVALHGAGARGDDNVKPMSLFKTFWAPEMQKKHPAFILAPQMKRSWSPVIKKFTNYSADEKPVTEEMLSVFALVEEMIKANPIDPDRVYIVGQSMGGFGTWDAMVRRPELWAAAVPICGGGDPSKAAEIKHIPTWVWHGSNDTTVSPQNSRDMVEALKKAGGDPKYSEVKAGHGSWNHAFASEELYEWLFAQKRQPAAH